MAFFSKPNFFIYIDPIKFQFIRQDSGLSDKNDK
jgi:hypothetical protein